LRATFDGETYAREVRSISGYYNGKRNNTTIEPDCNYDREMTVIDAVKNVIDLDK
jgi:hypothetical protein